jgi:hypothetical protein
MNPLFWPTLALGVLCFWLGLRVQSRAQSFQICVLAWTFAICAALPGIIFAGYYTKLFGEPLWLYRFRAIPGTELTAAGLGLLAGLLQASRNQSPRFKKLTSAIGIPLLFSFALCLPHLKPLLRPLHLPDSPNDLSEGVCRQSTPSTCGPASAVTLAHQAGIELNEHELARAAFTSTGGTENWYLVRALRARGLQPQFMQLEANPDRLPYPAIAGVRLKYATATGHFIPILGETNGQYQIGDPMRGPETMALARLRELYAFTGFFLIVK